MRKVLVTGGRGTLGRHVVRELSTTDASVRVLTRSEEPAEGEITGDLTTGDGLADAVAGVDTIIHCAMGARYKKVELGGTGRLLDLARMNNVKHFVYISIVGVDINPFPYYKTKLQAEQLIEASGIGFTILRATQFHQLVLKIVSALSATPIALVPRGFSAQPIDVEAVAKRLVELAAGEPAGHARDIGGPRVDGLTDLLQVYCASIGISRPVLPVAVPGKSGRAFEAGANLLGEDGEKLGGTFDQFVAKLERTESP